MNAVVSFTPPDPVHQQLIELSFSRKTLMQQCGRAYRHRYEDRLASKLKPATLVYGKSVHTGFAAGLTSLALGGFMLPAGPVFTEAFSEEAKSHPIEYSAGWDEESMTATGLRCLELFEKDWLQRGWSVVVDVDGIPVVEREFKVRLPGNIIYTAIIDALVRTADNKVIVVDAKTPAQVSKPEFYELSDQQLGYQIVVDAHAQQLGIDQVDGTVFYEMTKTKIPKTNRGKGPQIHVTEIFGRRDDEAISDWLDECKFVADDIRNKRHTRRSMSAFNSPCLLCDFSKHCRNQPDPTMYKRNNRNRRQLNIVAAASNQLPF